jgi:hypothetical protein
MNIFNPNNIKKNNIKKNNIKKKLKIKFNINFKKNMKILNVFLFKKPNSIIKNINELNINDISNLSKYDSDFYFNKLNIDNPNKNHIYIFIEVFFNKSRKIESKIFNFDIENGSIKSIILNTKIPNNWDYEEFNKYFTPNVILSLFLSYKYLLSDDIQIVNFD